MATAYSALAFTAIAINLFAWVTGGITWQRNEPSLAFWYLLRTAQVVTGLFVLLACVIYATGHRANDELHYLYVLLPVVASLIAELMRGASASQELGDRLSPEEPKTSAELGALFAELDEQAQQRIGLAIVRRETAVMALACLVVAFLVWRAIETTAGMF